VMLLAGNPLHAFDLDRVAGGELTVRRAADGEQLTTLDGQTRTLDPEMVLIADADGPTSIAGLMGGARSEVSDVTTRVLMEAANWYGANIHRTSLALGLRSEASTRYEKQLAPEQALDALVLATQLMIDVCGARLVPGTIDVGGPGPDPKTIRLRSAKITGLLGVEVPVERCTEILTALEFGVAAAPDGLDVTVPPFRRTDVTREADLIEEVSRLGALESLPSTLPSRHGASGRLTDRPRGRRPPGDALAAQGLHEIVGWSFEGPGRARQLRIAQRPAVELQNPMSAEQSRLRTTLLGSLLDVARSNRSRGASAIRLFEAGAVYLAPDAAAGHPPAEPYHVGALLTGAVRPATWREPEPRAADFYAAKGALGGMLDSVRVPWTVAEAGDPETFLHPGRCGQIVVGGVPAGWIGELHPEVAAEWGFESAVAAFELDLDVADETVTTALYADVTSFPEIREDLAVIVSDAVPADEVLSCARRAAGALLSGVDVFDVYRDPERIGAGNVSLALRLHFRAADRTLTDEEVAGRRRRIAAALTKKLSGRVRDA
jgi:phenylalanyl-tRNA synthetase beta chain